MKGAGGKEPEQPDVSSIGFYQKGPPKASGDFGVLGTTAPCRSATCHRALCLFCAPAREAHRKVPQRPLLPDEKKGNPLRRNGATGSIK